nr:MAG TPA: hypothetical protein [Caudoviricetes sp.]
MELKQKIFARFTMKTPRLATWDVSLWGPVRR